MLVNYDDYFGYPTMFFLDCMIIYDNYMCFTSSVISGHVSSKSSRFPSLFRRCPNHPSDEVILYTIKTCIETHWLRVLLAW